jgi:hypothetical protein
MRKLNARDMRPQRLYCVLQDWKLFTNELNCDSGHADDVLEPEQV